MQQWLDLNFPSDSPGLTWIDKQAILQPETFTCCHAEGPRWDEKHKVARSCRLLARKKRIDQFFKKFAQVWPEIEFPWLITAAQRHFFLTWLSRLMKQEVCRGHLRRSLGKNEEPSHFWLLAFLANWRFGYSTHIYTLGKSKESELIPPLSNPDFFPMIYFLENVTGVWKPELAEQVNTIVNWCEQSQVPLWMELRELEVVQASDSLDPKEAFRARISKMKSRPVFDWLAEDCLSRLQSVCVVRT